MTASVLKQDPNTQKVKKECYLLGQNTTWKFSGDPRYKTTLKQQLNSD